MPAVKKYRNGDCRFCFNKILFVVFAAIFAAFFMSSCKNGITYAETDFFAMDTYVRISADGASPELLNEIKSDFLAVEKQLSATYPHSDIRRLPDSTSKSYKSTVKLLSRALEIAENTDGAFDFTLGSLVSLWNINGASPRVPEKVQVDAARTHTGYKKVSLDGGVFSCADPELSVDLGAFAKGYAGGRAMEKLKNAGIENASISVGGNVTVAGSSPRGKKSDSGWNVAINNPFDTSQILGTVEITDKTVSVSGSYERFFEQDGIRYHHIIDPKTGYPAHSGLVSAAVICDDAALADALSTALFVMGLDGALEFYAGKIYDFEALFCTESGEVFVTDGLLNIFVPERSAAYADNNNGNPQSFISFPQYN